MRIIVLKSNTIIMAPREWDAHSRQEYRSSPCTGELEINLSGRWSGRSKEPPSLLGGVGQFT